MQAKPHVNISFIYAKLSSEGQRLGYGFQACSNGQGT